MTASCGDGLGGSTDSVLKCAASTDGTLQNILSDPNFGKDLKKLTGKDLGEFVKGFNDSGATASNAIGGAFGNSKPATEFAAAIKNIDKEVALAMGEAGTAYAGGGKTSSQKSGATQTAALNGIFENLFKKDGMQETGSPGVSSLQFKLANREPAALPEDTSVSLFDRVTFRYQRSATKIRELPWMSRTNAQ